MSHYRPATLIFQLNKYAFEGTHSLIRVRWEFHDGLTYGLVLQFDDATWRFLCESGRFIVDRAAQPLEAAVEPLFGTAARMDEERLHELGRALGRRAKDHPVLRGGPADND